MVQLNILSGKKAGTSWVARRFPVRIGRSKAADLQLEEDGIWEQHLQIDFNPAEGFVLTSHPDALTSLNGQPFTHAALRSGDTLQLGSSELQFWLSDTRQGGLRLREWLTWTAIGLVCVSQILLIYLLLR